MLACFQTRPKKRIQEVKGLINCEWADSYQASVRHPSHVCFGYPQKEESRQDNNVLCVIRTHRSENNCRAHIKGENTKVSLLHGRRN